MSRLLLFMFGFIIFVGCLMLIGYCYENCIEVSDWWHDLVGFMEFPLFGIGFILLMILLIVGFSLMGAAFISDENEVKE